MPFAAKFGYTEEDLLDVELDERLREEYARFYGHDPSGNWILIVHQDDSSEIYRFDGPADMWCCRLRPVIKAMIEAEAASATTAPKSDQYR